MSEDYDVDATMRERDDVIKQLRKELNEARDSHHAPTRISEPVAWQWRVSRRDWPHLPWGEWGHWRDGRALNPIEDDFYRCEERPLFTHPAPTRDDVLEEAAKVGDQVAKEQYQKPGYKEHGHTYSMIVEGAQEVSSRIRSLKGGKSWA